MKRTLPLRRWLALALLVTFVVPAVLTAVVAFAVVRAPQFSRFAAADRIRDDADRWHDPAWQAALRDEYSPRGIDFVLFEDGREIYRSTPDPVDDDGSGAGRFVQEVTVAGAGPRRTALIYANVSWWGSNSHWAVPLVALSALAATLGGIGWVLGKMVVRPLGASAAAARQAAGGDLEIALPSSRVREVAEVNTAFEAMGAGLRQSLEHEAALEQERRLFIGAVAHDLRTPLFALRGYLEGIATGVADTAEKRAEYVAIAREKADDLELLIGNLFDYTRLEYLDQAPTREPLDLCALLRRVVEGLQPQAEVKGVRLTVESATSCLVDGDRPLLTRAVENLLDNALRFTPGGGSVTARAWLEGGAARFSIADSGPGIPSADLPNLFKPLYRGESSRNRRTGGAGLGLTIARRILLAHGGDLSATNGDCGGAVFAGWVPVRAGGDGGPHSQPLL